MYYNLEAFGRKISQIRKNLGYTQKDISNLSSLTIETLRKIENGKVLPTQITLELLSPILKVDLNQLLLNYRIPNYDEFNKLKNKIECKIENGNYFNLENDLKYMKKILDKQNLNNYAYKLMHQFYYFVEAIILKKIYKDYEKSLSKLIFAMKVMTPKFNQIKYKEFVYCDFEIRILMNIALLFSELESVEKCQEMLLFCLNSINSDEINIKLKILYNISYTFHKMNMHSKALYFANEGIKLCIENNKLNCLAHLYSRKGIAQYFLRDETYITSLRTAINLYNITNQDNFKKLLIKFCKKYKINTTKQINRSIDNFKTKMTNNRL